ncbi:MAG: hypothetical protein GXO54_05965 [Chloroflexi bacterium]|nr:hypothetical protein [Chloroflexota bacterium]
MTRRQATHSEPSELDPQLARLFAHAHAHYPPRDPARAAETEAHLRTLFERLAPEARSRVSGWPRWARWLPRRRAWLWAVLALGLMFAFLVPAPRAVAQALPGSPWYPVKLWVEHAQLWLTRDPARAAELHLAFAQARLQEARALLQAGEREQLDVILRELQTHVRAVREAIQRGDLADPNYVAHLYETLNTDLAITAATASPEAREAFLEQLRGLAPGLFVGPLEQKAPQQWHVGGRPVYVHPSTQIFGIPQLGDLVEIHGYPLDDGSWVAQSIRVAARVRGHQSAAVEFVGRLEGQRGDLWVVNGLTLHAGPGADIRTDVEIGDWVEVEAVWDARKQAWILWHLEPAPDAYGTEVEFAGRVTQKQGNVWWVEGHPVWIVRETRLRPDTIPVGAWVVVHAWRRADGSLVAEEIYELEVEPSPTPTASPDEHP